jgi:hypothetical protein
MLTLERLKQALHYCPETGAFTKLEKSKKRAEGSRAEGISSHGYYRVTVDGKRYYAHRLAWFYMTGEWPKVLIDHIDECTTNNRWNNLRLADKSSNSFNTHKVRGLSQYRGVAIVKRSGKEMYLAQIRHRKQTYKLGIFNFEIDAAKAYDKKAFELEPEFCKLNFPNELED